MNNAVKTLPKNLRPLIDADVLTYECCMGVEYGLDYTPSFDRIADNLELKIKNICTAVESERPPELFLTGEGNFRFDIAKTKPYKNRDKDKRPWHYKNIRAHMIGQYGATVVDGMEADDALCIEQQSDMENTIICTRDKDLHMQEGWHYGWENARQAGFGPKWIDWLGEWGDWNKVMPTGKRLFFYQLIAGDTVDNIPGIPRMGAAAARKLLEGTSTYDEMYNAVREAYTKKYEDEVEGGERMLEQGRLLHICNAVHEDGSPVIWELQDAHLAYLKQIGS